uniref:Dopa-dioxygenase n=1 Tax=Moniliophthora roreri TaxID=221103 RepID=A0A0W0FZS4_MONRR
MSNSVMTVDEKQDYKFARGLNCRITGNQNYSVCLKRQLQAEFDLERCMNKLRQDLLNLPSLVSTMDITKTTPVTDLPTVLETEIKEWHFHIYFYQKNAEEHHAALELRDAVLRLRRDGAFVAVPLFRVNTDPIGPHPVGSYEIWVPAETFSSVFSYLCMNRGNLSILVHPLTREHRA